MTELFEPYRVPERAARSGFPEEVTRSEPGSFPGAALSAQLVAAVECAPAPMGLWEFGSGRLRYLNPAAATLVGFPEGGEVSARRTADVCTDAAVAQAPEVSAALTERGRWCGRTELRHLRTGAPIPAVLSVFVTERDEDGHPLLIGVIGREPSTDGEQEHPLLAALEEADRRCREQHVLAELSRLAVTADLDTLLTAATAEVTALLGVRSAAVARVPETGGAALTVLGYHGPGPRPTTVAAGRGSLTGYAATEAAVVCCPDRARERRFATADMAAHGLGGGIGVPIGHDTIWGVLTAHFARPRPSRERDVAFVCAVAAVLSTALGRIEAEERLRHRSLHDPLTGLPNRTLALERLRAALDRAAHTGGRVAVLMIDLDNFRHLNARLGHAGGDAALIRLADRLRSAVRPTDTVARLGGDEFLILCPAVTGPADVIAIADRIATVDPHPGDGPITASIGIAVTGAAVSPHELIHHADRAMYRAKATGPGRYALHHPDTHGTGR
ncbi:MULTISPECIES: diguanylate cyclase domain-containing protein [unclassified Rhodococcus (in: high G+C Gram-positive bacteria)]|uniref:diguanylate cyclase domain-containing protein n=1 Tax=unclassified Rhodococcus (in: high G+C Gram-positive bacteria) TaxID=192944 RepID=UPI00163A0814|nr:MULTISPECIES: diguanylate cyclase [unclassified Rhodococcus (in: high G+C Gram-positive bacteria)]MBC2641206.1 diguanylate cyclase [Rhodococcus sp. 3A]MBC2894048.1 diguanylate cyclase [Rhodococcus sp. 4CII]